MTLLGLGLAGAAVPAEDEGSLPKQVLPGVVVEEVGPGSALEEAGLRPGDLLLAWERSPSPPANPEGGKGEIRTVFDWSWVTVEQVPRGGVRLRGERNGLATSFDVSRGVSDARVRPRMAPDLVRTYMEGRRRVAAGDLEGGVALWNRLVQAVDPQAAPGLRCWLLLQIGEAWWQGGQGGRGRSVWQAALAEARGARAQVAVLEALGDGYEYAGELDRAEAAFRSALKIGETAWGESLQVAGTMAKLGGILPFQGRSEAAAQLEGRALELRQRWAPDSLAVADSLHQLFMVATGVGDREAMFEYVQRALTLQERWPADSLEMADTLNDVGVLASMQGRHADAAAALQRALAILERRAPGSIQMANSLSRLGWSAGLLGDSEAAVEAQERALAIRQRLAPESVATAAILHHLGIAARDRGDLAAAAELFQRAFEIVERVAPESRCMLETLNAAGTVELLRGNLDAAWDLHRRALKNIVRFPSSLIRAVTLNGLGLVAEARGDLDQALDLQQQAYEIHERWAPTEIYSAKILQDLGRLYRRQGRLDQAAQRLARAVAVLESQVGRLGGYEYMQATFRAAHAEIYRDAIGIELERGHAAEALHLVERSRARTFLTLLAQRDLTFPGELPAALERSRRDNAARYDQALGELSRWTAAKGEAAREALDRELGRLRQERDEIAAEIRKASPRVAALRQPQPLDLAAAREVLDAGTLALSYSVGEDQTALFAVTREGGLRVAVLPVADERLRQDVAQFLEWVRQPPPVSGLGAGAGRSPAALGRSLYRTLIEPVADLVEQSDRVLILPDGPLYRLPFDALIRDPAGAAPGRGQYLAEWKPLHTALSLTVYGALRESRAAPSRAADGSLELVAFGDPRYPKGSARSGAATRDLAHRSLSLDARSFDWGALPYSRYEVERIAEVHPSAQIYVGEEATEERAKSVARDARILHFATHGYVDDHAPLDSALVLTIPEGLPAGRDNGLLQVWEIFESLRLDADLVVLSACKSALGRELSGEGMIGLTRAFQYAGARSVVATLWDVTDQVTAELMARFHRHLAAGLPKDEALRAAQIELIHQPIQVTGPHGQTLEVDASDPFFWAAFQLFGEWQ